MLLETSSQYSFSVFLWFANCLRMVTISTEAHNETTCLGSKGLRSSGDDKVTLPFKRVCLFVKLTQTQKGSLQWVLDEAENLPVWGICHEKMFCKGQSHTLQE